MDENELIASVGSNAERCVQFDPYEVIMQDSKGRVLNTTVDEIINLFEFVKKLMQGKDEIIKLLEDKYKHANEVKKNG